MDRCVAGAQGVGGRTAELGAVEGGDGRDGGAATGVGVLAAERSKDGGGGQGP